MRVGVSKAPTDQLRLINRHCLLDSKLGFEGYSTSSKPPQRVMNVLLEAAKKRGFLHPNPRRADTLMISMAEAVEMTNRIADRLGIAFVSKEEKKRAIIDILDEHFGNDLRSFGASAKKKPGKAAWL